MPTDNPAGAAVKAFATSDVAGVFAYRFSGFANKQDDPWWLTGIGRLEIAPNGDVTGWHRSAIMRIDGMGPEVMNSHFVLEGTITMQKDGSGTASILFRNMSGGLNVQGAFFVMVGGDVNRLWMISAGAVVPGTPAGAGAAAIPERPAHESVTLEAVRLVH
jgi:hypothetical protein